jgi:hypothetical protein
MPKGGGGELGFSKIPTNVMVYVYLFAYVFFCMYDT